MAEYDYEFSCGEMDPSFDADSFGADPPTAVDESEHEDPGVQVGEFVRALQESMGSAEVRLERWEFHRDNTIYDIHVSVRCAHQGATKAPDMLENTGFFQVVRHVPGKRPATCHQSLTAFSDGEALVRVHFVCVGTEIHFVHTRTFEKEIAITGSPPPSR